MSVCVSRPGQRDATRRDNLGSRMADDLWEKCDPGLNCERISKSEVAFHTEMPQVSPRSFPNGQQGSVAYQEGIK